MKKLFFILAFVFTIATAEAQLNFTDAQGNALPDTVSLEPETLYYFYIKNNSDTTVHIKLEATEVSVISGSAWEVCGLGTCVIVDRPAEIGMVQPLEADSLYKDTHLQYTGPGLRDLNSIVLKVYNPYNTTDSAKITFLCEYTTSAGEVSNVAVYPTYTSGLININVNAEKISVYSLGGQLLKEFGATRTIDFSSFEQGIYVLKIITADNRIITRKILKQ